MVDRKLYKDQMEMKERTKAKSLLMEDGKNLGEKTTKAIIRKVYRQARKK